MNRDEVTASEVGCYTYCARAWYLEHVRRVVPGRGTALRRAQGVKQHELHGRRLLLVERLGRNDRFIMASLLVLALLAALAATLLR
jgi:hypothetical protein